MLATRTSDTAFVFGSGRSLLELGADDWRRIGEYNTISLREFPRQSWVRADYHLTGEIDELEEYAQRLRENPLYANTIFVVMGGFALIMFWLIKQIPGSWNLRVSKNVELEGLDIHEHGTPAYHMEFGYGMTYTTAAGLNAPSGTGAPIRSSESEPVPT